MPLPGLNYVVLDANQLTIRSKIEGLFTDYRKTGQYIALPWVHLFEQSKGSADWFDKVHEHLRTLPRAVFFPKPSFGLIHEERRTKRQPAGLRAAADRRNTVAMRAFLADPRPTADISRMRAAIVQLFRGMHATGWLNIVVSSVKLDTEDERRAIRRGLQSGDREPLRESVVGYARKGRLRVQLESLLRINGISWRHAEALTGFASMSALTILAHICLGLQRNLQTGKTESEDNPACDVEAVLTALYGRGFVTADTEARNLHEDMRAIARAIWP